MAFHGIKFTPRSRLVKGNGAFGFEALEPRMMLASDLYITEFSASNSSGLADGDGINPDWIELFNTSSSAINLGDYYLTDDSTELTKWNLPNTSLGVGQFLVVFASGQEVDNYVDAGGSYHTNFRLGAEGEYLAAVYEDPLTSDLSVVHEYSPGFPAQMTDVSYGLAMFGSEIETTSTVSVETDIAPFFQPPGTPYTPTFAAGGPSSTDLLQGLLPTASSGSFSGYGSGGLPVLTDGSVETSYGDGSDSNYHDAYAIAGGANSTGTSVTYSLGTSVDLSEIVIYGGWVDGGRDEQNYEVFVSSNNGSSFRSLGSGASNPGSSGLPASSRLSFQGVSSGVLAAAVTDIRVDFYGTENGWSGYMEIDAFAASGAAIGSILVDDDTPMSYLLPPNGLLGTTWTQAGFDDSSWPDAGMTATAGIGYENSPGGDTDYSSLLDVVVPSGTTSAYTRFEFDITDPTSIASLTLGMLYDDGFVAYLNGVKVADANAPENPIWNSIAGGEPQRPDETVLEAYVNFDISEHIDELQAGTNVLAIHALNLSSSSDMLMVPRLSAVGNPGVVEPLQAGFFGTPTPGSLNGDSFQGFVADTKFSVDRGFYSSPFLLSISTPTPGASIIYTTDGSIPTVDDNLNVTNGTLYTGAVTISATTNVRAAAFKDGFAPTNVDTYTYVFLDDVIQQTAASQEAALEQGLPANAGNGTDFGLDPDILNSFTSQQVKDSLLSLPTISLTMENSDFLGANGIYSNSSASGPSSERPVSAELINPDGSSGFQVNAGIRIQGAASRFLADKYSFRLAFRGEYGPTDLLYPLFGDGVDKFDTVVLRSVFNDGYGWSGDGNNLREQLYVRDLWFRETQLAMGQPAARGNWAHLYVNGQYWGLYHPSERPDANFAQETLGGDNEDYDSINHGGVIDDASENDPNNNVSADAVYNTALSLAASVTNASGTVAKNAAYQQLQGNLPDGTNDPNHEDYLDVENYIDYMIVNIFGGNDDWPTNNWFTNRLRGPDSEGFRFFAWDSEISLSLSTRTSVFEDYTGVSGGAAEFYDILRDYEEFRVQFGDRLHKHLFNDGALAGGGPAERFESLAVVVRDAIIGESARWGDQHFSNNPVTQAEWDAELSYMLTDYFVQRPGIAFNQFSNAGLYPDTDAPEFLVDSVGQHGGTILSGVSLAIDNPGGQGVIYFTTDGTDPRLVGGGLNTASTTQFTSDLTLTATTAIKSRVLHNGEWSALSEAEFVINPATPGSFVITELNYNPYDALTQFGDLALDNDEFEFIELRNVSNQAIDLAGVQLVESSEGVSFSFSPQVLSANESILVVKNQSAFESRYGFGLNIAGEYGGALSNGGETITLLAANGSELQVFTYDDTGDWPGRADGTGSSLEIVDPAGDYSNADNWRSSSEFGGSPGVEGAGPVQDVIVNEVLSHSDGASLDMIELYNTKGSGIDLKQWYLSDNNNDLFKYQFTSTTILGGGQYLVLNESQLGFALDGTFGEDVWLVEGEFTTGRPKRFADHVEFDATDTDITLGRWLNGDHSADLFPMTSSTFGSANSGPVIGEVVISEVHYNPAPVPPAEAGNIVQDELEFVELVNVSDLPVDISNWKVDGIAYTFPAGTILAADEAIVLVTFDPILESAKATAFRNVFGIGSGPRLFGSASGQLNNAGERVKLLRPEDPVTLLSGDVLVDAVRYRNMLPWPNTANGGGDSLQRVAADAYGGFVTSWLPAAATPGSAVLTTFPLADFNGDSDVDGNDFLTWQRGFGTTGTANPQDGDADGDYNVGAADLAVWQNQYGTAPLLLASVGFEAEQVVSTPVDAKASSIDSAGSISQELVSIGSLIASVDNGGLAKDLVEAASLEKHLANEAMPPALAYPVQSLSAIDEAMNKISGNEPEVDKDGEADWDAIMRSYFESNEFTPLDEWKGLS